MQRRLAMWMACGLLGIGGAAQAQRAQVTFWQFDPASYVVDTWNKVIADFNRKNPNIEVKMEIVPWNEQQQRLITAVTAGGLPDVSYLGNNVVAQFQAIGALEPLDRYMGQWSRAEGRDITRDFWPGEVQYYRLGGQFYAVPFQSETRTLYYRKDLFRQAGLDPNRPPRTWDELYSYASRLQRNGVYGLAQPMSIDYMTAHNFAPVYLSYGGRLLDAGGRCGLNTPAFKTALRKYTDVLKNGGTSPNAATASATVFREGFRSGRYAMLIDGPWTWVALQESKPAFLNQIGFAQVPQGPRGRIGFLGGVPLVMWKSARNKDAAAAFLRYATDPGPNGALKELMVGTGQLPGRISLARQAPFNTPPFSLVVQQLAVARPFQYPDEPIPQMGQIEVRTLQTAIQQVALGQRSVDAATVDLCNNLNSILGK
ncbi:ABC transporter substrate-binding protein [Deinococcus planocerae]|uniref:ABC transporter substrate-binding protein n=1 Tax=Deinococcus planocerae TaxID=1737569 RepID=UPI000C7EFC76|nr:sugar ABC transporter substrate-binding protein [Deinococcus planocerae]